MRSITFAVVAGVGLLLPACAFAPKETIVDSAFDYNLALERTQNEVMLLNIVRASRRRPMYFTAVATLRGSLTSTISTGSLTIPFGRDVKSAYSLAPSLSYTSQPQFDVAVLDTKGFWLGVLKPVPVTTLKYYWEQGWPQDLLLHMFVRTIEDDGELIENYPGNAAAMQKFRKKLEEFFPCSEGKSTGAATGYWLSCKPPFVVDEGDVIGLPFKRATVAGWDGDKLANLDKANLKIEEIPNRRGCYHIVPKVRTWRLALQAPLEDKANKNTAKSTSSEGNTSTQTGVPATDDCGASNDKQETELLDKSSKCIGTSKESLCNRKIYLRSPEAMLFYLGEITRAWLNPDEGKPRLVGIEYCRRGPRAPLFLVRKSTSDAGKPIVAVNYDEGTYAIVKEQDGDREVRNALDNTAEEASRTGPEFCARPLTMTTLTLVLQLLALQKEGSELPVTGAVTVVGSGSSGGTVNVISPPPVK